MVIKSRKTHSNKICTRIHPSLLDVVSLDPKRNPGKTQKICACFIWSGSREKYTQPWSKWDNIALPKSLGGWGLKNIFLFSKALAAKACWRLISDTSMWTLVIAQKYISPNTIEDWIRRPQKSSSTGSIIWK
jgi:hypothetical protein